MLGSPPLPAYLPGAGRAWAPRPPLFAAGDSLNARHPPKPSLSPSVPHPICLCRPHHCQAHKSWVLVVAWSPDAQWLASGDMDGVIHVWEPK